MRYQCARVVTVLALCFSGAVFAESADVREALRNEIEQIRESGRLSIGDVDVASGDLLARVYELRGFEPAWSSMEQVDSLLGAIRTASDDGLTPTDYHLAQLEEVRALVAGGRALDVDEQVVFDIALTDSLIRLGYHQRFGKVNPYDIDPVWNFTRELGGRDPASAILDIVDSNSVTDSLARYFPREAIYSDLRDFLREYREIAAAGGWPEVPSGPTLRPGSTDTRLPVLSQRLVITGDLAAGQEWPASRPYGGELEDAVRNFQERHGLDADGVVGPATLRALNVPVEARIEQLRVNLERGRWVLDNLEDDFVIVNIAGFRAYLYRDREPVWSTRVVVGKTYHKTPVFRADMKYIVFNPTWTVPYSIATKEMLPAIRRDPNYLAAREFDVKNRNGDLVDPASIDWNSVSPRSFPYTFVQRPGTRNALGEIKFMFPNQYSVYLHDTPSKSLFARTGRTFSHGCVRVENPFDFAEVLLAPDGWDRERIEAERNTRKTQSVVLSRALPVLLLYWTAEVGEDGQIRFYDDVYERDGAVLAALDSPYAVEIPGP